MEQERFPLTVPVAAAFFYSFITLSFISIQAIASGLVQLQQETQFLLTLLVGGIVLYISFSIAITRTVKTLLPRKTLVRLDQKQALAIVAGLVTTSVWQLYINQIKLTPFLAGLAPQTGIAFKLDNAIAEESAFGAVGIVLYLFLRYRLIADRVTGMISASLGSAVSTAVIFDYFHNTSLAYSSNPNALLFIFGLRMILTTVQIYTRSLFSGIVIHAGWNLVT